jgi:hypothetical protein
MEESTPSETKKETAGRAGAGKHRPPTIGKERKQYRVSLGTSERKEEAVVFVGG